MYDTPVPVANVGGSERFCVLACKYGHNNLYVQILDRVCESIGSL